MKLSQDYVQVPLAARSELKGAALAYFTAHAGREVWRSKVTLPGHLIATTNDPAAGGFPFKQFLPEGVHLGWARGQADGQLEFVRKNLSPITRSAAPATPASVYGEQHQVYAAAQCQSCGNRHAPSELITETETTRFKLLQFAAEISTITNPLIDAQRSFIRKRIAQVSLPPAPKVPPSEKKAADQARSAQLKTAQTAAETRATKIVQRPLLDRANREHAGWLAVTQGAAQPNPLYAPSRDTAPTRSGGMVPPASV